MAAAAAHIISIHAPLAGSDYDYGRPGAGAHISIHAPLAGSDLDGVQDLDGCLQISIHAPLAGSDKALKVSGGRRAQFQSTLPSRGATCIHITCLTVFSFQSTLPSRGATERRFYIVAYKVFQSTLPSRGATPRGHRGHLRKHISIHAPLAGSDFASCGQSGRSVYFNPRSPRGERPSAAS